MTVEKLHFYRQSAKGVSSLDKKIDARTGKGRNTMDIFVKNTEHPSPTARHFVKQLEINIQALLQLPNYSERYHAF